MLGSIGESPLAGQLPFNGTPVCIDILHRVHGQIQVPGTWPVGVLSGIEFYEQWWMVDPGALHGRASSNTIRATTP